MFIFILVVSASGCINIPSNNTGNNNQGQNTNQSPNTSRQGENNSSFATDIIVSVTYQGPWNGTISDNTGTRTVQGNADNRYNLGPNPGTVSVIFQKADNSTLPLLVQILRGSAVIESQNTNATQGFVSIRRVF